MDSQVIITIVILLLIGLLFLVVYINGKKIPQKKRDKIYEKLDDLESQTKSTEVYARRDAIIKLDNLLGKALNIRYSNDLTTGDNLKQAKKLYDKQLYQQLWDVHKIRNDIVHDDREISFPETEEMYRIYKLGIRHTLR